MKKKLGLLAVALMLVPVMVVLTACGGATASLRGTWVPGALGIVTPGQTTNLVLNSNGSFVWGELEGTWTASRDGRVSENVPIFGRITAEWGEITITPEEGEYMEFQWQVVTMAGVPTLTLYDMETDITADFPSVLHTFTQPQS
ncbi:MAG: hypothetical protein FWE31_02985 [Firmicutes bacterium]|nr:hypothetical protein [Bacillota bacterium]